MINTLIYKFLQASAREREKVESKLIESREEVNRLVVELEVSNGQRASLEQDLQRSIMDRDHVRIAEGQKSAKLRAQLAEEVADKKKQIKALEDAVEEIQRLKLTVKSDKRESTSIDDDEEASKGKITTIINQQYNFKSRQKVLEIALKSFEVA